MYIKKFSKFISIIMVLILLSFSVLLPYNAESFASQTSDSGNDGWIPDTHDRLYSTSSNNTYGLSELFDPRKSGQITSGKDQAFTKLCWLFASVGAIEQYALKKYGSKFDLSEAHAAVALSNYIIPNNFSGSGYYDHIPNTEGNSERALQYFTNWNTPIFTNPTVQWSSSIAEEFYPFTNILSNKKIDSYFTDTNAILNVTGAEYIQNNISSIKQAIYSNGAVVAAFDNTTPSYYNYDDNNELNYYRSRGNLDATHAIALVGWDDNYSKDNFGNSKPNSDGAWLVKNSYKDKQYFWLSYEEGTISNNLMTVTGVQKATSNEKMLSYDYYPAGYTDNYFCEDVYLCNVFDVSNYTNSYNQINKVMLYLRTTGCTYEIKIMQLDADGNLPESFESYSSLATGEFNGEGYLTANLNHAYNFTSNKKCAIIVKLSPKSNDSKIYIPFEDNFEKPDRTYLPPEINSGESFYGLLNNDNDIVWNDCYSNDPYNIVGNLIIRPVLYDSNNSNQTIVNVSPTEIIDNNSDISISISGNANLFSIHTSANQILRQDIDYTKTTTGITLSRNYINSLNDSYTELVFEFNDNITKSIIINPKSTISNIDVSGKPIVGKTLSAICTGNPPKSSYDVNYQWQISTNGTSWYDITNANSNTYTISENEYDLYIRVKVTSSNKYGNVIYPLEKYSDSTQYKAVILGDVDLDGDITVMDSTLIKKYLVQLSVLNERQQLSADVNEDGNITILDATCIEKIIVG